MKHAILLAAALSLGACDAAQDDAAPEAPETTAAAATPDAGFEAVAPGNYEIVHADGTVDQLTILPGMTWAMVGADGAASGGTIFAQAGKTCFVTEGVEGHRCFAGSEPAKDGSIAVTGDDGETATVRPVESFAT